MPGLVNALLVRWAGGFHVVEQAGSIAAHGRHEGFLSLGAAQSTDEVERVAAAVFEVQAQPRVATTVAVEPSNLADTPYVAFDVADYVTAPDEAGNPAAQRVKSLSVTEDELGNPTFIPELSAIADELDSRLQRWLRRMANGTLGGSVESASPAPPTSRASDVAGGVLEFPPFSVAGPLVVSASPRYYPPRPGRTLSVTVSLETAGTSQTIVELRRNGIAVAGSQVTLDAGVHLAMVAIAVAYAGPRDDYFAVAITTAGAGARDLDAQVQTG